MKDRNDITEMHIEATKLLLKEKNWHYALDEIGEVRSRYIRDWLAPREDVLPIEAYDWI